MIGLLTSQYNRL